jgi:hypothetical protein
MSHLLVFVMEVLVSTTSPALDETARVHCGADDVRSALCRIRDAHTEVSLADIVIDDEQILRDERRSTFRAQLQLPVVLTPVDWFVDEADKVVVCGGEQIGVTRDVSPTGIGLTHDHPLGSDAVVVQFDLPDEGPLQLVLDLRWSVRKSRYSFLSGGRVVGRVDAWNGSAS